ncbi:helix-turn-helix domain-containing protein [Veillonella magna]|nr:helix-turn-helix domain-containing protein [Veillonella magna]
MRKGRHINMETLTKICEALDCEITDVIELVRDEKSISE